MKCILQLIATKPYFSSTETNIFSKGEKFYIPLIEIVEETDNINGTPDDNVAIDFQPEQLEPLCPIEIIAVRRSDKIRRIYT